MAISQVALEHVDNLEKIYELLSIWLIPQGFMSHVIDFKSHGTSNKWNGHLTYSDLVWKIMKGNRKYFLNRHTYYSKKYIKLK
jgi:hypothetical protein